MKKPIKLAFADTSENFNLDLTAILQNLVIGRRNFRDSSVFIF